MRNTEVLLADIGGKIFFIETSNNNQLIKIYSMVSMSQLLLVLVSQLSSVSKSVNASVSISRVMC